MCFMTVRRLLLAAAALVCASGVTAAVVLAVAPSQVELVVARAARSPAPSSPAPSPSPTPSASSASPRPASLPPKPVVIAPAFRSSVLPVSAERLGSSHRPGCPVAVGDLRLVEISYRDLAGGARSGELVVHADVAAAVVSVFRSLYDASFPVALVDTVDRYGSDDDQVMAANVTSAYNCRFTTGGTTFSEHAYGRAIDLNPVQNPYVRGGSVAPPAGRDYLDRSDVRPGMVVSGGVVVRAFAAVGWEWGGSFRTLKDYQHFSQTGR